LYFKNIVLQNFRNFAKLETEFIPQVNIILGDNGQGKTNLIESLFVLTQGDSFRYSDNSVLVRKQPHEESAILRASVHSEPLKHQLALEIDAHKKTFFLDQKKTSSLQLRKLFPVVLFSPESLSVIKESDEERRNLVDDVLLSLGGPGADSVKEFRKVLKTRNRILRDLRDDVNISKSDGEALLQSINPLYLDAAVQLTMKRLELIQHLDEPLRQSAQKILFPKNPGAAVDISVEYVISGVKMTEFSAESLMESMRKRQFELQAAERSGGATLVGPHKHDIRFVYDQKDSRFFCSQGQQRALIISFKMAQIVYHRKALKSDPVLMLDDVLSELDQEKRLALVKFLEGFSSQIFITSTDVNLPDLGSDWNSNLKTDLRTSVKRIQNGALI
jgi:DNA replication and repair protein RecF